jgi:hypothetical protein
MNRGDPQRLADYLGHILQAIDSIRDYTSNATLDSYLTDRKTQDAVVRNLEVIGEASNNVVKHHAEFAAAHSEVPWRLPMRCATRFPTATSLSITRSSGKPFSTICHHFANRFRT